MKLIVIYGPPASGKLTVAKELSKITGFKLFHNHLVNDALSSVMEFNTKSYWKRNKKLKIDLIKVAHKEGTKGLIFTMVYVGKEASFVRRFKNYLEKNGSKVYFVKLECGEKELFKRVKQESRKQFKKLRSIKALRKYMKKYDVYAPLPLEKQFVIDNTKLSGRRVADMVANHYKLRRLK